MMCRTGALVFFFFNDTATTEIYTLSLHDALPISGGHRVGRDRAGKAVVRPQQPRARAIWQAGFQDRSEEHTSELQSRLHLVCRLLLEKKKTKNRESIGMHSTDGSNGELLLWTRLA